MNITHACFHLVKAPPLSQNNVNVVPNLLLTGRTRPESLGQTYKLGLNNSKAIIAIVEFRFKHFSTTKEMNTNY